MPKYYITLRRDVVYASEIEVEADDADAALEIARDQVEWQERGGWPNKRARQRNRARWDKWVQSLPPDFDRQLPPEPPKEEDITHPIIWEPYTGGYSDKTTICCAYHYGPDGNTRISTRTPEFFEWARESIKQAIGLQELIRNEQHSEQDGPKH